MIAPSLLLPEQPRRIRRAEYDRMAALGLFDDERIEFIRGVIVAVCTERPAARLAGAALDQAAGAGAG